MGQRRNAASKWWRPIGYWALTINVALGFSVIILMAVFDRGTEVLGTVAGTYGSLLAAWAAAAGIRQWGKNSGAELEFSTEHANATVRHEGEIDGLHSR